MEAHLFENGLARRREQRLAPALVQACPEFGKARVRVLLARRLCHVLQALRRLPTPETQEVTDAKPIVTGDSESCDLKGR